MKKILFFSFCFLLVNICFAQDTVKSIIVKWVISSLVPDLFVPDGPNISLGVEYNYKKKNSISFDFGYILYSNNLNNFIDVRIPELLRIESQKVKGFSSNVELRHYLKRYKINNEQVLIIRINK